MRVPTQVVEYRLGAGEGPLRIHDPIDSPELTEERDEATAIDQIGGARREGQVAAVKRAAQAVEVFRTKDAGQRTHGKQERRSAGDPP